MSDHILVNFQTVHNAAEEVKASTARIEALLNDLKKDVTRISQSWQGAAQEGYNAQQAKWDNAASNLHDTCGKIAGSLENAAQSYKATEDQNSKMWANH
ncbi:WXG100 family type VII secretion target [Kitasatospora sp. NPDC004669]|uniref:WXG100 family type VII secretion target n=1 Tax=Kitasatospora sp. NPDC004669 TaxID=3154555 RepID=UPI0033B4C084